MNHIPISPDIEPVDSSEGGSRPRRPTMLVMSCMRAGLGEEVCWRVVNLEKEEDEAE